MQTQPISVRHFHLKLKPTNHILPHHHLHHHRLLLLHLPLLRLHPTSTCHSRPDLFYSYLIFRKFLTHPTSSRTSHHHLHHHRHHLHLLRLHLLHLPPKTPTHLRQF